MYISIDMGGTNTRVASSKDLTEIHKHVKFKTKEALDEQRSEIADSILNVSDNLDPDHIRAICVGVPGLVDRKNSKFLAVPNYSPIDHLPFTSLFVEKYQNCRIITENDAALAGLGEAVYGAGESYESVAYLTISTGVGGVRIPNDRIDLTQRFYEPGHHIISQNGPKDTKVDINGTLDAYISGDAFVKNYGIDPENCTDPVIWEEYSKNLATGIINVISFWAPDVIVIGGGISNKLDQYISEPLHKELSLQNFYEIPKIVKSALGDNSGLLGGFAFIQQLQREFK